MLRTFFEGLDEFLEAWYLTATVTSGILTAIVLAAPKVVVAGFYLLLLPGLFLAFMPTTFLWLLSFGGFWLVARNVMSSQLAITISVCLGGLILWGLPLGYQFNARNQLAPFAEKNVYPAQKIALAGDIELEYVDEAGPTIQTNGPACGRDCADLLFMNGVTSVTISRRVTKTGLRGTQMGDGSNAGGIAWVYKIVPKAQCNASSAIIDLTGDVSSPVFGARQMRLASGFCIVASPSKGEPIDMMLTARQYKIKFPKSTQAKGGSWGLETAEVSSFKIVDAQNKVLLNEQVIKADTISAPLVLNSDGNPFRNIWFSWWRQTINAHKRTGPAEADLNRGDIMERYSNLGQGQAADMSAQSFVPVLRAALDDPDIRSDQPAFRLTPMYFKQLSKTPPNDIDVALIADLIEDPRVKDFENLYAVLEPLGKQGDVLIGPLVARLTQAQNQGDKNLVSTFDSLLSGIGEGGYATLRPDVATILESEELRRAAPMLVMRQSDRSVEALPFLIDTMAFHLSARAARKDPQKSSDDEIAQEHGRVASYASKALCRLGPSAKSALTNLDAWQKAGLVYQSEFTERSWSIMLVRLGRPVNEIPISDGLAGQEQKYRENILALANRVEPVARICNY